jgi:hypothetical protein
MIMGNEPEGVFYSNQVRFERGASKGSVFAYKEELDEWIKERAGRQAVSRG